MRLTPDLFVLETYANVPFSLRARDEDGRLFLATYYDDAWHIFHPSALMRGIDPRYLIAYSDDIYNGLRDAQDQMMRAEREL